MGGSSNDRDREAPRVRDLPAPRKNESAAVSSAPLEPDTVRFGASASAATVTAIVAVDDAVSPPSLEVATTVRLKSASEFAGGVIVKPES